MQHKIFVVEINYPKGDFVSDDLFIEALGDYVNANVFDGENRADTSVATANVYNVMTLSKLSTQYKNVINLVEERRALERQIADNKTDDLIEQLKTVDIELDKYIYNK